MIPTYDLIERSYTDDYKKWLGAARKRGVDIDVAEDIVQETFARALKFSNSYDRTRPFDGWIYTILTNAFKDRMSEERRLGMGVEFNDELESDSWHSDAYSGEVLSRISQEISEQPEPLRDIYRLYFLKEYKPRDIAQVLDVTNNSVRSAVKRYRKYLEERYAEKVRG